MPDVWGVFDYEVDMFLKTLDLCKERAKYPHPIPNAVVESLLLHTRILIDILLSRCKKTDDIRLADLVPGFTSPQIAKLASEYGTWDMERSPCWTLNKMLAHATTFRSDQYDYTPMLNTLLPTISALLDEIASARRKP